MKLRIAPVSSNASVVRNTLLMNLTVPLPESRFIASRMMLRPFMLTLRPMARITPAPTAVTPRPPIWISIARKNCPRGVNVSPASMAIRPVTQTALVEVYSASM